MEDRTEEYRSRLAEIRERGGNRWRTPRALREEIVSWATKLQSAGHGIADIAGTIGLSESALRRWLAPSDSSGKLRRVRVEKGGSLPGLQSLVMVTPAGYRLEGLNLDQAVEVLRRL